MPYDRARVRDRDAAVYRLAVGAFARVVMVAAVLFAAAACTGSADGVERSTASPAVALVAAQRRGHAERVVAILLGQAVVPPGAHPYVGVVPTLLAGPFEQPRLINLVDRSRVWVVSEPPAAVVAFARTHASPALEVSSAVATSGQHGRTVLWGLTATPTGSFGTDVSRVELLESVVAAGSGSLVRVDALAVWLTPRDSDEFVPASDHVVTISSVLADGPGTPRTTGRVVVSDPREVNRLATIFNDLPVDVVGVSNCGAGRMMYRIAYSTSVSARPDVVVTTDGCAYQIDVHGHRETGLQTYALVQAAAQLLGGTADPVGLDDPAGLSPRDALRRDHPPKAPPFPNMTGIIDPKANAHHSGGPYVTARQAADIVLKSFDCRLGGPAGTDPNTTCAQVDVRFFEHYANFWAVEGGQTEFVGSWGPDREMYVVTIFGNLPFITTAMNQTASEYTPDRTYQIDATTGRVLMSGGYPLPTRFPGVTTFRAP